jgi:hypothetical protein
MSAYLLDVSTLMALLWETRVHNERVTAWEAGQQIAVCPITDLASLAAKHGMQLATLDESSNHQAAFIIPAWNYSLNLVLGALACNWRYADDCLFTRLPSHI